MPTKLKIYILIIIYISIKIIPYQNTKMEPIKSRLKNLN